MVQATAASVAPKLSSQTVPHLPATSISRRPAYGDRSPASLMSAIHTHTFVRVRRQRITFAHWANGVLN